MTRLLASLSAALLAVTASAQCLNTTSPGVMIGNGDDIFFGTHYPLGFTFPMNGAYPVLAPYTSFQVCTNGWLVLTNGVLNVDAPANNNFGSAAALPGTAGASPRIAPFWRDVDLIAPAAVYFDNTSNPGVSCKITWVNAVDFGTTTQKSFRAELFANGAIEFSYSTGMNVDAAAEAYVAISPGNAATLAGGSDLSTNPSTPNNIVFEQFLTGSFDLPGRVVRFTPTNPGWSVSTPCLQAFHQPYGKGCYSGASSAFYQHWASAPDASAALQGNVMNMLPTTNGYFATWLPGLAGSVYVPPTGAATALPLSDDGTTTIVLTSPLTLPGGGTATDLAISHNGIITIGTTSNNNGDYTPTGPEFSASTEAAFYTWSDFRDNNVTPAPSGVIKYQELGGILYVTWDGVDHWAAPQVSCPSTFQFQFNLAAGSVDFVWVQIHTNTTSAYGDDMLVGYTDQGVSADAGTRNLATSLPLLTAPDSPLVPLSLSASPAPVYTVGGSTVPVTYTVNNIIDVVPPFNIGISALIFSVAPIPGGLDLGFLGMPGCNLNIASLDVFLTMPGGTAPSDSITLSIPQPLFPGLSFYSQALSLFTPNSLPNGQNAFGGVMSNGLQSGFNTF